MIKTLADYADQIDAWHDLPPDCEVEYAVSLHEYLGLTWEQYGALVENGKVDLP